MCTLQRLAHMLNNYLFSESLLMNTIHVYVHMIYAVIWS